MKSAADSEKDIVFHMNVRIYEGLILQLITYIDSRHLPCLADISPETAIALAGQTGTLIATPFVFTATLQR